MSKTAQTACQKRSPREGSPREIQLPAKAEESTQSVGPRVNDKRRGNGENEGPGAVASVRWQAARKDDTKY